MRFNPRLFANHRPGVSEARPDMIRFQRARLGSVCEKESKWEVFFSVGVQRLT